MKFGKKPVWEEVVWKLWCTVSTSEHSPGRHWANSCRNSSLLVEDAALLFCRMVGYTYTHLQKRRRVKEILTCRKMRVLRFYALNRGICAKCVYSLLRTLNLLGLAGCKLWGRGFSNLKLSLITGGAKFCLAQKQLCSAFLFDVSSSFLLTFLFLSPTTLLRKKYWRCGSKENDKKILSCRTQNWVSGIF